MIWSKSLRIDFIRTWFGWRRCRGQQRGLLHRNLGSVLWLLSEVDHAALLLLLLPVRVGLAPSSGGISVGSVSDSDCLVFPQIRLKISCGKAMQVVYEMVWLTSSWYILATWVLGWLLPSWTKRIWLGATWVLGGLLPFWKVKGRGQFVRKGK